MKKLGDLGVWFKETALGREYYTTGPLGTLIKVWDTTEVSVNLLLKLLSFEKKFLQKEREQIIHEETAWSRPPKEPW